MSFSLPGMQVYPITVDSPSGETGIPVVAQNPLTGTQHIGTSVSGSYTVGADLPSFILIFGIATLGLFAFLHYISGEKLLG